MLQVSQFYLSAVLNLPSGSAYYSQNGKILKIHEIGSSFVSLKDDQTGNVIDFTFEEIIIPNIMFIQTVFKNLANAPFENHDNIILYHKIYNALLKIQSVQQKQKINIT